MFLEQFLTKHWRHFGKRFCSWNKCLTKIKPRISSLSVPHVTCNQFKRCTAWYMAEPTSIKRYCFQNLLHPLRRVIHWWYYLNFTIKISLFCWQFLLWSIQKMYKSIRNRNEWQSEVNRRGFLNLIWLYSLFFIMHVYILWQCQISFYNIIVVCYW